MSKRRMWRASRINNAFFLVWRMPGVAYELHDSCGYGVNVMKDGQRVSRHRNLRSAKDAVAKLLKKQAREARYCGAV